MDITFLTLTEVLDIHLDQISRYGGLDTIRDKELLLSALAQPSATFAGRYLHQNLYEMAAAYCYHIIQNHPFVDGNKRTGIVTSLLFLWLNEIEVDVSNEELERIIMDVAKGVMSKQEIASWFEKNPHTINS